MAAKKSAKKTSKKRAKPGPKSGEPSKSDFIRGLPRDTPAKEVVAKAKEAGMALTEAYVYAVRSASKGSGAKAKRAAKAASPAPKATRGRKSAGGDAVREILRIAISSAGIDGAGAILADAKKRLDMIA